MENTNRLKTIIHDQIPNGESIIFDFFVTFSRFECALKNTNRFLHPNQAQALWDRFSDVISSYFNPNSSPELRSAVDYILNEPPRKQIVNGGRLEWQESIVNGNLSLTRKLVVYIRRVRNNLLHGGKFNGNFNPDSRNFQLIINSTIILDNWVDLDAEIRANFLSDINQ